MKVTVLAVGRPPAPLDTRFGTYPELFRDLLDGGAGALEFDSVAVYDGESVPEAEALEAALITGSPVGVYEDHAWIAPLSGLVRDLYEAGIPTVGICFGHQIMAQALGGEVRKSEKGWGVGRHVYDVAARPAFMADAPAQLAFPASHQDQVITPPEGAEVILHSEFTPFAGLAYGNDRAISFQPHPEFSPAFAGALYDMRHRKWLGDEATDSAIASLERPTDNALLGGYLARFYRHSSA